jgi:hypothetical protein
MNIITVFEAMKRALSGMETCVVARKNRWGIRIDKDHYAIKWQKRERQYIKFESRVFNFLKKNS